MKAHICSASGCFTIVAAANTYCAQHQALQRERDEKKKTNDAGRWSRGSSPTFHWVYRDPRWRKVRKAHITAHPACFMCGAPGTEVDHIIPHRGREEFAFNPDNLQTLCHACHAAKTRAARAVP